MKRQRIFRFKWGWQPGHPIAFVDLDLVALACFLGLHSYDKWDCDSDRGPLLVVAKTCKHCGREIGK